MKTIDYIYLFNVITLHSTGMWENVSSLVPEKYQMYLEQTDNFNSRVNSSGMEQQFYILQH